MRQSSLVRTSPTLFHNFRNFSMILPACTWRRRNESSDTSKAPAISLLFMVAAMETSTSTALLMLVGQRTETTESQPLDTFSSSTMVQSLGHRTSNPLSRILQQNPNTCHYPTPLEKLSLERIFSKSLIFRKLLLKIIGSRSFHLLLSSATIRALSQLWKIQQSINVQSILIFEIIMFVMSSKMDKAQSIIFRPINNRRTFHQGAWAAKTSTVCGFDGFEVYGLGLRVKSVFQGLFVASGITSWH